MRITIKNLRDFVQGHSLHLLDQYVYSSKATKERALKRASLCPQCFEAGKCPHCKCSVPAMFFAPNKKCPNGKW